MTVATSPSPHFNPSLNNKVNNIQSDMAATKPEMAHSLGRSTTMDTEMKSLAMEMKSLTTEMKSLTTKMKSLTT